VDRARIAELVQQAVQSANLARPDGLKLSESADAPVFGPASPLDSLGLVALLIDIEDLFAAEGRPIVLSDERALSERRSPYRNVPSLVDYIERLLTESRV
jgi:hypothetical protein